MGGGGEGGGEGTRTPEKKKDFNLFFSSFFYLKKTWIYSNVLHGMWIES